MKKIAIIFFLSFCLGQNTYVGSINFDYFGTANGTFQAVLNDTTSSGAAATVVESDSSSILFISAIQILDSTTVSALLIYMQADSSIVTTGEWFLPSNDLFDPNIIFGFFPEVDTSFFSQFTDLIPDSIDFDSTVFDDLMNGLISVIIDDSFLGITGNVSIGYIDSDSLSGSFDVGALQAGFPPGVISISNGMISMYAVTLPQVNIVEETVFPDQVTLYSAYPNPFNPVTTLRYELPESGMVNITIYDMLGRQVKTLVNRTQDAGYRSVIWDATNDYGKPVSAGIYLYQIQAGEYIQTKKMVLLK